MSGHALTVKDLFFSYDRPAVLHGLSFSLEQGSYCSIIGPNGAGKSTLLKCIMGIHTGTGEISVKNLNLADLDQKTVAGMVSYVPQNFGGSINWSVYEFVGMGRYPYMRAFGSLSRDDHRIIKESLGLCSLEDMHERGLNTLSGGEQQRALIAAAIAQEAELLLLDEPGSFLDPKHQEDVNILLHRLTATQSRTILSVTHDINSAALYSDRIIALKDGKIAFDGAPSDLMSNEILAPIFDTEFIFVEHPENGQKQILKRLADHE